MTRDQIFNDFKIIPFCSIEYLLQHNNKKYTLLLHFNIIKQQISNCEYTYQILQRYEVFTEKRRKISITKLDCGQLPTLRIEITDSIEQALIQTNSLLERIVLIKMLYLDFISTEILPKLNLANIDFIEI